MSFSSSVKDELAELKTGQSEERESLLCALSHTAASMKLGRGLSIEYVTESMAVALLIKRLIEQEKGLTTVFQTREQEGFKKKTNVVSVTGENCAKLLIRCGCLPEGEDEEFIPGAVPERYILGEKMSKLFLRGAFLGAGSISDPKKGYHMEFVTRYELFAETLCALLADYELSAKITQRKSNYIVYIKDGESISDFLRLTGATEAVFKFEDIRMHRFTVNNLNRKTNFEEANMQKAALASAQQILDIRLIIDEGDFARLTPALRQTAEARLTNPEANLGELAEELGVGKSGVNHRLAKLSAIASDIRLHNGGKAKQ